MSKFVSMLPLAGVLLAALAPMGIAQEPAANVENTAAADSAGANDTEILANQGATFAAKERIAVFSGDVRVRDPRFTLACDKLTVYLAKGSVPDGTNVTPAPTATPPPIKPADATAKDAANRGGGIDHAVAEGHVIIVQKRAPTKPGEEEKTSVGRAETVEFDNQTGDLTLRGLPKLEQNGNFTEALSRSTYMILGKDNSLKTVGPSKTKIIQNKDSSSPSGSKPASKSGNATPANRRGPAANANQG